MCMHPVVIWDLTSSKPQHMDGQRPQNWPKKATGLKILRDRTTMRTHSPYLEAVSKLDPKKNDFVLRPHFTVCKLMDDQSNPRKVDDKGRIVPLQ
jgi:hypothetical protein